MTHQWTKTSGMREQLREFLKGALIMHSFETCAGLVTLFARAWCDFIMSTLAGAWEDSWFSLMDPNGYNLFSTRKSKRVSLEEKRQSELEKDLWVAREGLTRASLSTFMDWKDGSTIYFWRWPDEYQKQVQDGLEVYIS